MGTTCSTLVLLPAGALLGHVGDSRIYRVRRGRIEQLTFDHSLVWELVRHKHLTSEQASKAIPRNVITRSLGPDPVIDVDIEGPYPLELGDVFLLCSDGLSGPVPDPDLGTFASQFHPEQACRYLIHLANFRGGPDNITAVIVRIGPWVEPGLQRAGPRAGRRRRQHHEPGFPPRQPLFFLSAPRVQDSRHGRARVPVRRLCHRRGPLDADLGRGPAQSGDGHRAELAPGLVGAGQPAPRCRRRAARGLARAALQSLGEAVVILGQAGRVFRKEHGPNGGH